ncbi:MAG: hypothetical protein ABJF01_12545 [bacterium]
MRDWTATSGSRVALGALAVAVIVTAWTLARALRADALPEPPAARVASLETITRRLPRAPADIQAAVESDLFSKDRSAPSAPYRMPGEKGDDDAPPPDPMKPVVLGTAVATDGRNFATLQLGDGHATLVHVGDKIGDWSVKAIERGKVTLVSIHGIRADVTVPKPGT